jgi:cytosine/creatinine deaminase
MAGLEDSAHGSAAVVNLVSWKWKLGLTIILWCSYLAVRLPVAKRESAPLPVKRGLPNASLRHDDNIRSGVIGQRNISPPIGFVVNVTPAPLPVGRAHVERDCVRLRTPIAALGDHVLRAVCQAERCHHAATAGLNDEEKQPSNHRQ